MVDHDLLAVEMKDGLGFGAQATSSKNLQFAQAILTHLKTGIVVFAPGTVTGTAPPSGGPLTLGTAAGGLITALVPVAFNTLLVAVFGTATTEIMALATSISGHFTSTGLVSFATGGITGVCSNTIVNPGVLVGAGANGKITVGPGAVLAASMASAMGKPAPTPQLIAMCSAITDHVNLNAVVTLPAASVSGVCASGGGPVTLGAAVGGIIT